MATPNSEQKLAIEHHGGVLLKAGAGSGKTFVLKEHMIFLAETWIKNFEEGQELDFEQFVKNKFRKIVLMTFTKKAAGELEIRLHNEFKEKAQGSIESKKYWQILVENISSLNVSTIHGFCYKLIKMGFFPEVAAEQTILTEAEYRDRLYEIFEDYLQTKKEVLDKYFYDLLLKDKNNVFDSVKNIFSDPTLRSAWKNLKLEVNKEELDHIVGEILSEQGLKDLFAENSPLLSLEEFKGKKWSDFLSEFLSHLDLFTCDFNGLIKAYEFFKGKDFKIPPKPSAKSIDPAIVTYYEMIRDTKNFLQKNGEHFYLYETCFESHVLPWLKLVKNLIDHIEKEYSEIDGVTFSDLEYIVYESLQDPKALKRIQDEFHYYIVDEFQDTSFIQYSILKALIGNDYKKLFCVGDLKQAIYGFRGGELGVFLDCEKEIPLNLSLKNNYRSSQSVISFNNIFFEDLFKLGDKYRGKDKNAVEVEAQAIPETTLEKGKVVELQTNLEFLKTEEKLNNLEVDYYEALTLFNKIKELHSKGEEVAILYKRLKPSLILLNLLIKEDIGFISQTKIPFQEDPILGIFYALLEKQFNRNEQKDEYQAQLIKYYISILQGQSFDGEITDIITQFYKAKKYFGLYHAFNQFLECLGMSNSQFNQNIIHIKTMIQSSFNDEEKIYSTFKEQKNVSYSLDFYYGKNSSKVKIMTAHASKGLQFEHVLLGGIYTNENSSMASAMIGKLPMSFKWAQTTIGKEKFKTPQYIYEDLLTKAKELSENKRLFYVANTRAVKTLSWACLNFGDLKRSKNQYNSWISGVQSWKELNPTSNLYEVEEISIAKDYRSDFLASLEKPTPFFHKNSLGIEFTSNIKQNYLLPELSVTRLATISECPRKFYFQNICKLTPEELNLLESPLTIYQPEHDEEELNSQNIYSSASRGTYIHEEISKIILDDFSSTSIENISSNKDKTNILWVVENLKKYLDNSNLISEKPIKFELLGYMISGIPDLIIKSNDIDTNFEVWDFKTGKFSEDKLAAYWFQLYCYAYAGYILEDNPRDNPTRLVVCFVDEQRIIEKNVLFTDVDKYLINEISKTNQPDQVNTDKCEYCPYDIICKK